MPSHRCFGSSISSGLEVRLQTTHTILESWKQPLSYLCVCLAETLHTRYVRESEGLECFIVTWFGNLSDSPHWSKDNGGGSSRTHMVSDFMMEVAALEERERDSDKVVIPCPNNWKSAFISHIYIFFNFGGSDWDPWVARTNIFGDALLISEVRVK